MHNDPNQPMQPSYGQGQSPYGQSQPPYLPTQPAYGQSQPPYPPTQPAYGQPQPPYAPPPSYGMPPGGFEAQASKPKKRRVWLWVILGVVAVLLLACVGSVFAVVYFASHSPATDVVNHYYTAIEHQDYATAYGYIDPSITLTTQAGSQQITQDLFTQVAQGFDTAKGKVTGYSITNTSLNSNNGVSTGDFIVSVTRNGPAYNVHLQLKQEGTDWKIVGFDNL